MAGAHDTSSVTREERSLAGEERGRTSDIGQYENQRIQVDDPFMTTQVEDGYEERALYQPKLMRYLGVPRGTTSAESSCLRPGAPACGAAATRLRPPAFAA